MSEFIEIGLILLVLSTTADGQVCSGTRCGQCLIFDGCAWCKDPDYVFNRCAAESQLSLDGCRQIVKRKTHSVQILQNNDFSDGGPTEEPVQIKPQRMKITLVPNESLRDVMVFYKIAKNFPLDLYFLNDPSYTMRELVASLRRLATNIADDIATITTDFRFGLGTAMDKVIDPFTLQDPKSRLNPCGSLYCDKPYSFIHRLSLTNNVNEFTDALSRVNTTANQDIVEGLFDGLMQVMVCGNRIGWRSKARRMVLYATDINFHHAGDGRVAGILEPNDCLCHLDGSGKYTKAEIQDYPSVGQIVQKARENNINIIFVIGGADNQIIRNLYYDQLTAILPGGVTNASALSTDASNILNIVRENYRRLRETVKLITSGVPEEITLDVYTNCRTGGRTLDKTNICTGLNIDIWTNFTLFIKSHFTVCPDKRKVNFTVFPEGLEERVQIEVEHVCDCDCQLEPKAERNSTKCNSRGTYECGICHCDTGWSGKNCECDERGTVMDACGTDMGICSNAGNCTCRKCSCFEGYSGDRCECNDRNCPSYNGLLCGGNERGQCSCGECICDVKYNGSSCECPISTEACKDNNGTLCSVFGVTSLYSGAICERCQHCPGTCGNNKNCVECVGFNQGLFNETICLQRCQNVEVVSDLEETVTADNETTLTACVIQDKDACVISFNVYNSPDRQFIEVKSTKRCPLGPPNPVTIGASVSGAIFLVGLILILIWKLLTMLYDKLEYSKFESEIQNPIWEKSDNPIYKECVTTVQNPVHEANIILEDGPKLKE
ncbi:integrin beta pat-3-like [Saccostrea cucullata]|uniref:integrin beta pat-3-like n=1 Tax=Saccostrea cuccullata TaxID=36930 RepID=UPI002ED538A7